jgi:hypothetical protein
MSRFSLVKIVKDINYYELCKRKWHLYKWFSSFKYIGWLFSSKESKWYKEFIKTMGKIEVKYNPNHPVYVRPSAPYLLEIDE